MLNTYGRSSSSSYIASHSLTLRIVIVGCFALWTTVDDHDGCDASDEDDDGVWLGCCSHFFGVILPAKVSFDSFFFSPVLLIYTSTLVDRGNNELVEIQLVPSCFGSGAS